MQLSRRSFLGAASAAVTLPAITGCKCPFCSPKPKLAVQLYSIRGYMDKHSSDLPAAFAAIKAMGYDGVETLGGTYGKSPEEYGQIIRDAGLAVCGSHCGFPSKDEELKKACERQLKIGNNYLICAWSNGSKIEEWQKRGESFAQTAELAEKYGCQIGYHNHQHEFRTKFTLADGTPTCAWEVLAKASGPKVGLEMDVGWTTVAGEDPEAWFKKFPGRFRTIHAKETVGGVSKDVPADKPAVDWDKIARITYADVTQWWVVETERGCDALDTAAGCAKVLGEYCSRA